MVENYIMNAYILTENGKYNDLNIKIGNSYKLTQGNHDFNCFENFDEYIINKIIQITQIKIDIIQIQI
jgi:hypothetical protein